MALRTGLIDPPQVAFAVGLSPISNRGISLRPQASFYALVLLLFAAKPLT
jgi:hypothetical protein